ncbi:MAG TPA: CBS domain-containing protein [Pyrinomonadaceae bacterium]|nr:CBS domain-containing protein [Pyrinomonadaceae bacterium]
MKVKEIMTANPKACTLDDNLAEAARLMWEADCGIVPVVAEGGKVVGLITDRDICMAAMTKGRNESSIAIEDVISGKLFTCKSADDIHSALNTMRDNKVRRLPVVTADGKLAGMLSMNDVVLKAAEAAGKKAPELSYGDVVNTYKSICQHRLPMQQAQATTAV